ncbi:MAG: hypothetical protein WDN02_02825 [Methylovirgula sp.]|uniref:hypothetical protein n=1 Tax=Methylovirgula sp. TaxID=1978224 RepID=UPI0030760BB5
MKTVKRKSFSRLWQLKRADPNSLEWIYRPMEVFGLWAAAIVGAIAIWRASGDAHDQWKELHLQWLENIQVQRANLDILSVDTTGPITIAASKALELSSLMISTDYSNEGQTSAIIVKASGSVEVRPRPPLSLSDPSIYCPALASPIAFGKEIVRGNREYKTDQSATPHFVGGATPSIGKPIAVFIAGKIVYQDIFYPQTKEHYVKWCAEVDPTPDGRSTSGVVLTDEIDPPDLN